MSRSWMMAVPAALALLAGCATNAPPATISPLTSTGPGIGNAPGMPVASTAAPETASSYPMTESRTPAGRAAARRDRLARSTGASTGFSGRAAQPGAAGTEATTSGPSAAGRVPAPAQPVGSGGS